jgi:predicted dehydrogenase
MAGIRVGVVGVGYLGRFHAEKYAAHPDAELVGVADADAARAVKVAEKLNTRFYPDASELIGRVDALSIVVPTVRHYGVAKQFLERGVHVFLEKPMTVTLDQADELIAIAARSGLVLQVGHIERFNPAYTAVKGKVGSPRYLSAERAAPFTARCTDVNVVLDLMIHDLDIVTSLAGSDPKELCAAGASVITGGLDAATARIVYQNGCVADVTASRISDEKKRLLRVFGGDCVYTSDYQTQAASVSRRGSGSVPELITRDISTERLDALNEELRSFIRCVQEGGRPLVTGGDGRRALALALAVTDIIEKGITGFVPVS